MDGEGRLVMLNKAIYEGTFKDGKKNGFGVIIWPDKKKYKGYWKDDV